MNTGPVGVESCSTDEVATAFLGPHHALEMSLGFAPSDGERLIRTLRLLIDGGQRTVADASLGSANLLYLALKALQLDQQVAEGERCHTFLAIEEPEAHLHPHVQRRVYRTFLQPRHPAPPAGAAVGSAQFIHLSYCGRPPT